MKFIYLFVLLFPITSNASVLNFSCEGVNRGNKIANSPSNFDMKVDSSSGAIFNIPGFVAPGCVNLLNPKSPKISITDDAFSMSCENDRASTFIKLSRYSGKLNIDSVLSGDENRNGLWNCTLQKSKKF